MPCYHAEKQFGRPIHARKRIFWKLEPRPQNNPVKWAAHREQLIGGQIT
jgi:hypothetical protein